MVWRIELTARAERSLARLDALTAKRVLRFLRERLGGSQNPRSLGKPLTGPLGEYWSYRVGDYRILCEIHDGRLIVLVVEIGHRRDIYR